MKNGVRFIILINSMVQLCLLGMNPKKNKKINLSKAPQGKIPVLKSSNDQKLSKRKQEDETAVRGARYKSTIPFYRSNGEEESSDKK